MATAPKPLADGLYRGIVDFLTKPPAPIQSYSVLSTTHGRLAGTKNDKTAYQVSIVGKDTLRLERTVGGQIGTDRFVVAIATIVAVGYSAENELIIVVGG
jgi:hypothetical protein